MVFVVSEYSIMKGSIVIILKNQEKYKNQALESLVKFPPAF